MRRKTDRIAIASAVLAGVCLLIILIVAATTLRNASDIRRVEINDRDTARATAFRLCSRGQIDRAFAHSRIRDAGGSAALRELEQPAALPILDCKPNLIGFPARPLTPDAQRRFVQRWEQQRLTAAELGLCHQRIGTRITATTC